jgi:hypothetical protein
VAVASLPHQSHQTWTLGAALRALEALLAGMRYVATPLGRDPRLDLLRGFCVFAMIVDHIGGTSWLYALTGGNRGPITAAEGFVFLSGLVLGIVSRRRVEREGLLAAVRAALARAWTLYALTVALTLIFVGLTVATELSLWVDRGALGENRGWPDLVASVILLRFTWHGTDILALYALLLVAAPVALHLLAEGRAWRLLGASWGLWLLFQLAPERTIVPWPIEHARMFPLAAWQVLFMNALVLGYHRQELAAWMTRTAERPRAARTGLRLGLAAAASGLLLVAVVLTAGQAHAMGQALPALAAFDLYDKPSLGIGRLVTFAGAALATYAALTFCWRPIERAVGWLLIPLGQASLYAYAVHLFMILVAYNVPPYVGSDQAGWELHNTVGQLLLVLVIWAMVKRKVLFGLIPR